MLPIYVAGGLLAVGMIVGDIYTAFKQDVGLAYDNFDKLKTICFHTFQSLIFLSLAFIFSWIAVGFIYTKNRA